MNTVRQQLTAGIQQVNEELDNQPDDEAYLAWVALVNTIETLTQGFETVLRAVKTCRDAQNAYFAAKRAGLSGHSELSVSKKAEKELDQLGKQWRHQLTRDLQTGQTELF
jgi:CelD/BcsL family acetyltransferase involved in cellulose biosynthesis